MMKIPRAVSRSSSETSLSGQSISPVPTDMDNHSLGSKEQQTVGGKTPKNTPAGDNKKNPSAIGTEEKTAVAAILALKDSSSEDDSGDDLSLTTADDSLTAATLSPVKQHQKQVVAI